MITQVVFSVNEFSWHREKVRFHAFRLEGITPSSPPVSLMHERDLQTSNARET